MRNSSILPLGRLPFVNQVTECNAINDIIDNKISENLRGIFYKINSGSGFTRFLEQNSKFKKNKVINVYIDASSKEENLALAEFFRELTKFQKSLKATGKEYFKDKSKHYIDLATSSYHDFGGPGAKTINKIAELVGGGIRSVSFEKFRSIVKTLPANISVLFLIDNTHKNEDLVQELINNTASDFYKNIFFVIGYQESKPNSADIFLNKLLDSGVFIIDKSFPIPNKIFLEEILSMVNSSAPEGLISKLLKECNHNLHLIISKLRKGLNLNKKPNISDTAKLLLNYLWCAEQSLPKEIIKCLIFLDPTIYIPDNKDWFSNTLKEVKEYIFLSGNTLILLVRPLPFDPKSTTKLRCRETLYTYVSKQYNKCTSVKLVSLLYHLSKHVDKDKTNEYATNMVQMALLSGDVSMANRFFKKTKNIKDCKDLDEYILRICFLITAKKYKEALIELKIEKQHKWNGETLPLILKAVALNRCRFHKESISLIQKLIKKEITLEQKSLLYSFYIGGLSHINKKQDAYKLFQASSNKLKMAKNYGYFIRNSAGVCCNKEAISLTYSAISIFKKSDDNYGVNTSMCNLGSYIAINGDMINANKLFKTSKDYLSSIGLIHIEEVVVNYALTCMYLGDLKKAENTLKRVIRFASNNVPKYYALQVISLIFAINGNEESIKYLKQGYFLAKNIDIKPHLQRYISNAALISSYIDNKLPFSDEMILLTKKEHYCYNPEQSKKILNIIESGTLDNKNLLELFIPPFMYYWSQEPIFVLNEIGSH